MMTPWMFQPKWSCLSSKRHPMKTSASATLAGELHWPSAVHASNPSTGDAREADVFRARAARATVMKHCLKNKQTSSQQRPCGEVAIQGSQTWLMSLVYKFVALRMLLL